MRRIVIDEGYYVSQWGYDFRSDYVKHTTIRKTFYFPRVSIIALIATGTPKIIMETKKLLQIESSKLFISTLVRSNLKYDVMGKSQKTTKKLVGDLFTKYPTDSGIIFCFSKNDCMNAKKVVGSNKGRSIRQLPM